MNNTVFYAGPSPYEHTDTSVAMFRALRTISKLVLDTATEETARAEAEETLRVMEQYINSVGWLTDRLTQATIDHSIAISKSSMHVTITGD